MASAWTVVMEYARSPEGRGLYPKLRASLTVVDDLIGMTQVKRELAYTLQALLSYKKLEQRAVMTIKTRAGGKRPALATEEEEESPEPTPKRPRGESDVGDAVRQEVAKTLARLLAAAPSSEDDEGEEEEEEAEDEEEYDEVEIPKALEGEKMHCLIMGPTGCGKTTLANAIAGCWHAMGLVSGKFTAIGKGDIASKWQGESLMRISELIDSHDDGVLFIDEAYGMVQGKKDTYGNEVLTHVVQKMTDPKCRCTFILAGYEAAIKHDLLGANEGLERRFASVFVLNALTNAQLAAVYTKHLKTGWRCTVNGATLAKLLDSKPGLIRYGGADMVALVKACERAHITRFFPERISRRISENDMAEGIRLFVDSKARKRDTAPNFMYS